MRLGLAHLFHLAYLLGSELVEISTEGLVTLYIQCSESLAWNRANTLTSSLALDLQYRSVDTSTDERAATSLYASSCVRQQSGKTARGID